MKASMCGVFLCVFFFLLSPCLSDLCNQNDKKVLLQIKKSLNNPSLLLSWDSKTDCCTNWTGIECTSITSPKNNRVFGFSLYGNNNLNAKIPPEIGDLSFLRIIDISNLKNLTGTIPTTISKLKHLRFLSISGTGISGPIPEFVGRFQNLRALDLSENKLTGRIPGSIAYIPDISSVRLGSNMLTGSIPESFGSFKNKLIELSLHENRLSGTIPMTLSRSSFSLVNLSNNKLRGNLSMFLGLNKKTEFLKVSNNEFEFDFSKMKFQENLTHLYIQHNQIFGRIPQDLATLTRFTSFDFSYNRLCGKIPVGGMFQVSGRQIYSHNRCLCGTPLRRQC